MINTQHRNEMMEYVGQRKHGEQMRMYEIKGLYKRVREISNWRRNEHLEERLIKKNISLNNYIIERLLNDSYIVEYRIKEDRYIGCCERLILRSNHAYNRKYNLILVFDLTAKTIVTAWLNKEDDTHKTIDWSAYNKHMKVFGLN